MTLPAPSAWFHARLDLQCGLTELRLLKGGLYYIYTIGKHIGLYILLLCQLLEEKEKLWNMEGAGYFVQK